MASRINHHRITRATESRYRAVRAVAVTVTVTTTSPPIFNTDAIGAPRGRGCVNVGTFPAGVPRRCTGIQRPVLTTALVALDADVRLRLLARPRLSRFRNTWAVQVLTLFKEHLPVLINGLRDNRETPVEGIMRVICDYNRIFIRHTGFSRRTTL